VKHSFLAPHDNLKSELYNIDGAAMCCFFMEKERFTKLTEKMNLFSDALTIGKFPPSLPI